MHLSAILENGSLWMMAIDHNNLIKFNQNLIKLKNKNIGSFSLLYMCAYIIMNLLLIIFLSIAFIIASLIFICLLIAISRKLFAHKKETMYYDYDDVRSFMEYDPVIIDLITD